MESLKSYFTKALQATIGLTNNSYLAFLKDAVENVSDSSQDDQILFEYNQNLLEIVSENNFALNSDKTNEFAQLIGEAHFYLLCKNKGICLERIKEGDEKTPDFKFEAQDMYFEVKTLSVVSGSSGIRQSLEDSLDAQIDIEDQLKKEKRVAAIPDWSQNALKQRSKEFTFRKLFLKFSLKPMASAIFLYFL